ncbi:Uncharacterised protein [Pragia fontium]|uniref:hypothetical protein n=1 Tax=Pragia fontium TaxID=82985 RepID=UPI000DFB99E0|nr:hypothetical protein [Pragia fontium]SUB81996.1 Uncharacterised protein [Pragia fontium]
MEKIEIGKIYYYNNREVIPIEKQGDTEFYKCVVKFNIAVGFDASNFCTACLIGDMDGAHPKHTCYEYDDVIEEIKGNAQDEDILFIPERMLNKHPFEYLPNEKLKEQLQKNKAEVERLSQQSKEKVSGINSMQEQIHSLDLIREQAERDAELVKTRVLTLTKEEVEISARIAAINSNVIIDSSNKSISAKELLRLFEVDERMESLKTGGVDNWEWYGESLGNTDYESCALERLINL